MPFCTACGQSLIPDARFCVACGAAVAATPPAVAANGPFAPSASPSAARLSCTCCHLIPEQGNACPACGIPCTAPVPDPATSLLRLAEAAARQRDWSTCQTLADRLLERDLQMANAWMIRGEARLYARCQSGDWLGVRDLAADYRSAMDVLEVRSQSLVRFFHQRFLHLVKPLAGELIQRTRTGLDEQAAELQPLSNMDTRVFGSPWGFAKAARNARSHEEAKALMGVALPAMTVTREAAQKLMDGATGETLLDSFIQDLTRMEMELTEAFRSISEKADDNTLGDVLFGKWSRKYRT